jgi:capsular exopolysaccharide synthesis family protein
LSKNFELLSQVGRTDILHGSDEPRGFLEDAAAESTVAAISFTVHGAARDEVAKLVRNLFFVPGESAPRRVIFTGTESGTGCSWICAHAAELLASQVHGLVCVVDCNLRSPSLHDRFQVPNHHGLTDSLIGSGSIRQYVQRVSGPNLFLLSSGSVQENQQTLLASDGMRARLGELYAQFDHVLLDVASLNTSNDAIALGGAADGVVLVLRENTSRRETARKALQDLLDAKVQALGVVLNQRTFPIPEAIYKLF